MVKSEPKLNEHDKRVKIIQLQEDSSKLQHERRMKELEYARESDRLHHEREMERQRIKTAEINKTLALKERSKIRSEHVYNRD